MTPEREAEIREWTAQKQHCEFYGSHWQMASDLLAEIDRLRELRINSQLQYDIVLEEYAALKQAATPFIRHSAKLISQSTDGKAYMTISVPVADILNLRKVLKGE
jgi:hypothetical protein